MQRLRCVRLTVRTGLEMPVDPRLELAWARHCGRVEQAHDARIRAEPGNDVVQKQRLFGRIGGEGRFDLANVENRHWNELGSRFDRGQHAVTEQERHRRSTAACCKESGNPGVTRQHNKGRIADGPGKNRRSRSIHALLDACHPFRFHIGPNKRNWLQVR